MRSFAAWFTRRLWIELDASGACAFAIIAKSDFFTYDLDGNQYWVLGVAPPGGKSVTMEALYPSSWSRWGSQFNPDEVELSTWGDFTLTWTSCNELTFAYHSVLPGFGSATRNYTRITNLAGTTCPAFP